MGAILLGQTEYAALGPIYDAAVDLGRWRRALDSVSEAVGSKATALLIRNPDEQAKDLQMLNSTYLKFVRSPWGLYYGLRLSHLQGPDWDYLSRQPAHQLTLDTESGQSAEELDRRADYAMLRRRIGVGRRLGVRLNADRAWYDAVSFSFDAKADTIPKAAYGKIGFLLPHLTKAVEIGRTFAQLKARYSAVLSALDRVKVGLAIALPDGEIIVHNEEAARILGLKDGLALNGGKRLICNDPDQSAELTAAIARTGQTARGEDTSVEHLMALTRPSGQSKLLVDVAPLRDSKAELDGPLEGSLITIIDPDRVPYLRMDRFTKLYDLTPAEAEVCGHIVHGRSVNEIAEARSTSEVTAKNQVAAILSKTGVRRRAELIRLVIRLLPPVE